jgi:hypothetical protein
MSEPNEKSNPENQEILLVIKITAPKNYAAGISAVMAPETEGLYRCEISNGPITLYCIVPNYFPIGIYHCKIYNYWHKL